MYCVYQMYVDHKGVQWPVKPVEQLEKLTEAQNLANQLNLPLLNKALGEDKQLNKFYTATVNGNPNILDRTNPVWRQTKKYDVITCSGKECAKNCSKTG